MMAKKSLLLLQTLLWQYLEISAVLFVNMVESSHFHVKGGIGDCGTPLAFGE
jgi:hypothetical protein